MIKVMIATAAAVTMFMAAPSFVASTSAQADNVKMAQVDLDVQIGRDRERLRGERHDRDVDVTVGRRGVEIGPRERCRTVTTTVEGDNGRRIKKTERRCN